MPSAYGSPFESRQPLLDAMLRLGNFVPGEVELGYHLCYGDAGHKHFKEPTDTARLVDVANAVAQGLQRRLHWLHFPVPIRPLRRRLLRAAARSACRTGDGGVCGARA